MADVSLDAQGAVAGGIAGGIRQPAQDRSIGNAQDWISGIEQSNLTPRYYLTIALLVLQEMFEFYDFFLVGYLVSVLAPGWHLTYGQSAMMLLSSGVGAIAGSLVGGQTRRYGRAQEDGLGRRPDLFARRRRMCADPGRLLDAVLGSALRRRLRLDRGSECPRSPDRRNDADPTPHVHFQHDGGAGRTRHHVRRDDFGEPAAGDRLARRRCYRRAADRDIACYSR